MDRHEPPGIGPPDGPRLDLGPDDPPREAPRRFARLVGSPAVRRLAVDRVGRALLATTVVVALLVVVGANVSRSVVAWLHRRPPYRLAFREIALEPPPPAWIKGGREALLESIRDGRGRLETVSALDLDLEALLIDVRRDPWIVRAGPASKSFPNRVTVAGVVYREPVALVRVGPDAAIPVDREAHALPADELDRAEAGPLAEIVALPPTTPPRPGLPWPGAEDDRPGRPGARVAVAARLAGFFKDRLRSPSPGSWTPKSVRVYATDPEHPDQTGLWVVLDQTLILWDYFGPRLDEPGPSEAEKWRLVAAKAGAEGGLKPLPRGDYLEFRDRALRLHPRDPDDERP